MYSSPRRLVEVMLETVLQDLHSRATTNDEMHDGRDREGKDRARSREHRSRNHVAQ